MQPRQVDSMLAPFRPVARRAVALPRLSPAREPSTSGAPAIRPVSFWETAQQAVTNAAARAGVRADAWSNTEMGLGGIANRISRSTFLPALQLPEFVVDALLQFNGVGRRLCEREPQDATREGFSLGADPLARALHDHAIKWGILQNVRLGRMFARAYGGAAIVMMVEDGQTPDKPLDRTRIRRVDGAQVLHRYEITPIRREEDRRSPRVGKPVLYSAHFGGTSSVVVHHSRVIVMQGFDLPQRVMLRQQGWGGSVFDLVWCSLRNWQITLELLPEMASRKTQGVYTQRHLPEGVSAGLADEIVGRMEALQAGMSVLGDITISPEEKYEILGRETGGMREIVESLETALVADGDLPRLILYGETSGGLHAGKDNPEMRAWLDSVAAKQPEDYSPPCEAMLELIALSQDGPTGGELPRIKIEWLPLYQQTEEERNASEKSKAERRSIDVSAAVVSPTEARTDPSVAALYQLAHDTRPATPGIEPEGQDAGADLDREAAAEVAPTEDKVADLALNGAQVASLIEVVSQVNADTLTYEQGVAVLGAAFPMLRGRETSVLGPKGSGSIAPAAPATGAPVVGADDDDPEAAARAQATQPPSDPASPRDAAAKWGVPTLTITRMIRSGALPHWKIGTRTIVSLSAVGELAKAHERVPPPEPSAA